MIPGRPSGWVAVSIRGQITTLLVCRRPLDDPQQCVGRCQVGGEGAAQSVRLR